ncbi:MAG TPA: phosphate signaling complex protein PhoU [Verrucomicrobiae bacterium]|nr:phosphate signaling complex protein PhoU [Verrucomicrobiae bacterium]
MQTHHEKELSDLKDRLLIMASHAEMAVTQAVEAVVNRDEALARKVRADDETLDRFEVELDDMAVHLLAKAPLATELRLVLMVMKMSQNLERIGDEASKIANRARDLAQEPPLKVNVDIPRLARLVLDMLKGALDAFVRRDAEAARALIPRDKEVDALNKQFQNDLIALMAENPENIRRALWLTVVSKSLERIADHAKNVAEDVVYLCEALDIRHSGKSAPTAA